MDYITTTISVAVHPKTGSTTLRNPIYGERATNVSIEDEGGGGFIVLQQFNDYIKPGIVRLELEELEAVTAVAKNLMFEYELNTKGE